MHATVHVHVRRDTAISSSTTPPGDTPTITIQDLNGVAEVVLFFADDEALERVAELLTAFRHETPFHLAFRSGCPACERQRQKVKVPA